MYLKIDFGDDIVLLASIAADGNVYFLAKYVAKLLGYSNVYDFAHRYSKKDLARLVWPVYSLRLRKGSRPVFEFREMIDVIQKTYRFSISKLEYMRELWEEGYVANKYPTILPIDFKCAFHLQLFERRQLSEAAAAASVVKAQDWIEAYFHIVSREIQNCQVINYSSPPSVSSLYNYYSESSPLSNKPKPSPAAAPEKSFTMNVKADGIWALNSSSALMDVFGTLQKKMNELENDSDEYKRNYELSVKLIRLENED